MDQKPQARTSASLLTASTLLMLLMVASSTSVAGGPVCRETPALSKDAHPMRSVAKAVRAMARDLLQTGQWSKKSVIFPEINLIPPAGEFSYLPGGAELTPGQRIELSERLLDLPPPTA